MPSEPYKNTPKNRKRFIEVLSRQRSITVACKAIGISRRHAYRMRKEDPEFAAQWDEAWETIIDELEQSAMKRAIEGSTRCHYDKDGNMLREETVYETALTTFMIKHNREKYKDQLSVNVTAAEYAERVREALSAQEEAAANPVTDKDIDP